MSHSSFAGSALDRLSFAGRASVAIPFGVALAGLIGVAVLLGGVSEHRPSIQARSKATTQPANQSSASADHSRVNAGYAAVPLAFEPNVGQTDSQVKYVARGRGYSLFLTSTSAYFAVPVPCQPSKARSSHQEIAVGRSKSELHRHTTAASEQHIAVASIEMHLLGSNLQPQITAENQLPGVTNYILGRDPSKWRNGIAHYGQVRYRDVYPGVDLAYHGAAQVQAHAVGAQTNDNFEFDFLISPGVNPEAVKLGFYGSKGLRTSADGDLVIASAAGDLHLHRPFAYQESNGKRQSIDARFVIHANDRVSFALGNYDHSRQVVVDPTVTYSTYLGGSMEDDGNAITVDSAGNAYITGQTDSSAFPGAGGAPVGSFDVFVTKLSSSGVLLFTTLVGGSLEDVGNAIAVDSTGIYVAGRTSSSDFPIKNGPQQTFLAGTDHGFLFKLGCTGSTCTGSALSYSTFIEGSVGDTALGLAVDSSQEPYIVGDTFSPDLGSNSGGNGTVNPLHTGPNNGDSLNNGVAGSNDDGFIAKISSDGTKYLFLTYLGGSSIDSVEDAAIDSSGNVYVTGLTLSTDFPVTAGAFQTECGTDGTCNNSNGNVSDDAFVTAISSGDAPTFIYSTYLGGEGKDDAFAIAVDSNKNAYVTGQTFSTKFPTLNPLSGVPTLTSGPHVFVSSLNSVGTALNYSTYLGGNGSEAGDGLAVDSNGTAYVTGYTSSTNFPVTTSTFAGGNSSSFDTDAFVSELSLNGASLSLPFSTYLGGSGDEDFVFGAVAVTTPGNIYVTGVTNSANFPVTAGAADSTYNGGSAATCTLAGGGSPIPCPDAFVVAYANADFSIAGTPLAAVTAGSGSTSTITVTPFNGYSNTVNLSCSVSGGGTSAPTCQFSSNSISGGSGTSTLTVATAAAVAGTPAMKMHGSLSVIWLPVGMVLAGGGLLGAGRQRKKLIGSMLVCALLAGTILLLSCGGSSSTAGSGPVACSAAPGVPSGLAASGTTTNGTTLNWTADTAPSDCSIASYTVYENGTSIGTPTTTSFAVTGLSPSTTYSFTIAATDTFGSSAQSTAASVTTGSSGTPSGTYTITVTGTDGTITHSITPALTLTVN